jgi:hypothetical protein
MTLLQFPAVRLLLRAIVLAAPLCLVSTVVVAGDQPAGITPADQQFDAHQRYGNQHSVFIENRGQWDTDARFLLARNGLNLWLTDHGIVYDLFTVEQIDGEQQAPAKIRRRGHVVQLSFEDASFSSRVNGLHRQPGCYNYLIGNDPARWTTSVPLYGSARIEHLYNGIDALFYVDRGMPRYDLVVSAGADPSAVRIKLEGADGVSAGSNGDLKIATSMGVLEQRELYAYQEIGGVKRQVSCSFVVSGKEIRFAVGSYDRMRPLVIDPLSYSTFLGGDKTDIGRDIAVDAAGNAYVTGYSDKATGAQIPFPTVVGAYQTINNGDNDVFVTKLNPTGTAILYSTFIGGQNNDQSNAIKIDASGNAYITGFTANVASGTSYPTTTGAFQRVYKGGDEAFVTKLNAGGSALVYSTLLGGKNEDHGNGIAIDADGNAYVTGYTNKSTSAPFFPTTAGAFQTAYVEGDEVFVTKVAPNGASLVYSTYITSSNKTRGHDIAVDAGGNAYITGVGAHVGAGTHYPTTAGAFQTSYNGGDEVIVTKLNSSGSGLIYSTLLGGNNADQGNAIAVDADGNAYITGIASNVAASTPFPTTAGAFQTTYKGSDEVFVTKLNASGNALVYSTLIGGDNQDQGNAIAIDATGAAYITGSTLDATLDYPVTFDAVDAIPNGQQDVFVTRLNPAGSTLLYSTFLGGSQVDIGNGIAVSSSHDVFITGSTEDGTTDYPVTDGVLDVQHNTGSLNDAFVTKLELSDDEHLPVELTGLSLAAIDNSVRLTWQTASETANAGFEVQRASGEQGEFRPVASYLTHLGLVGLGTSSAGKRYTLVDGDLSPGLYRYRLIDISTDGVRTAHSAQPIRIETEPLKVEELKVFRLLPATPNPVRAGDDLQLAFMLPEEMAVTFEIFASDGERVLTPIENRIYGGGTHSERMATTGLMPGVYTCRLTTNGRLRIQRFVVVR